MGGALQGLLAGVLAGEHPSTSSRPPRAAPTDFVAEPAKGRGKRWGMQPGRSRAVDLDADDGPGGQGQGETMGHGPAKGKAADGKGKTRDGGDGAAKGRAADGKGKSRDGGEGSARARAPTARAIAEMVAMARPRARAPTARARAEMVAMAPTMARRTAMRLTAVSGRWLAGVLVIGRCVLATGPTRSLATTSWWPRLRVEMLRCVLWPWFLRSSGTS